MIPKIIHQTAPADENVWHPIWKECQNSWKNNFPDFEYVLWNDEDIEKLVKENYGEYFDLYKSFPYHIMRVDFARFCILHHSGGFYVDMDFFCKKNFYNLLKRDLYLVESWEEWGEKIQNSLMISSKGHNFWLKCMKFSQIKFDLNNQNVLEKNNYILESCGPKMMSKILDSSVKFLPKEIFNPTIKNQFNWANQDYNSEKHYNALQEFNSLKYSEDNVITRHYLTGKWGID